MSANKYCKWVGMAWLNNIWTGLYSYYMFGIGLPTISLEMICSFKSYEALKVMVLSFHHHHHILSVALCLLYGDAKNQTARYTKLDWIDKQHLVGWHFHPNGGSWVKESNIFFWMDGLGVACPKHRVF